MRRARTLRHSSPASRHRCTMPSRVFQRMDAPLVIAVNGTAAGAGFSLALSGDYILANPEAKFVSAYTASGLTPDGSSTYFLAKHVGLLRAKELVLTNRVLAADEALSWGIVSRVVANEELMTEANKLATNFAAGPTRAYGGSKRLLMSCFPRRASRPSSKTRRSALQR